MQSQLIDTFPRQEANRFSSLNDLLAKKIEGIKLRHRAEKYEHEEDRAGIAYICDTVKKGDIVFDIGAHKAGYLYFFQKQLGNSGSVIAFEPQPVLHKYLLRLKQLFCWENVHVESFAVSDQAGKAMLYIPCNHNRNSSPCATIIESRLAFECQSIEEVNTISIDKYCSLHQVAPDFLKVDVEGNELKVFQGAKEILRTYHPPILFECETRFVGKETMLQTFQFLEDLGYQGYFLKGDETRPLSEFNCEKHQDPSGTIYCNNFIFK
ncbi:MAG: FkbM family methyltransferase [Sediminibacterium sp.]